MAPTGPDLRRRIAEVIQGQIADRGTTVAQLAQDTGIPRTTLQRRLAAAAPFTVDELSAIAVHFDLDVADLLGGNLATAS